MPYPESVNQGGVCGEPYPGAARQKRIERNVTMNDDTADLPPTVRQVESMMRLLTKAGYRMTTDAAESELINVLAGVPRAEMDSLIAGLKSGAITGLATWRLDDIVDWIMNGEGRETL